MLCRVSASLRTHCLPFFQRNSTRFISMSSNSNINRFHTTPRYSEIVVHNNTVYLAGQCPDRGLEDGDMYTQTQSVFRQIDEFLLEAGSSKTQILSCQIFITDMKEVSQMNKAWEEWMPLGCAPARATMGVSALVDPRWKIEVCVTAAL
eukprot:GDKK01036329.1.p1 GENE.GDKK01036329.1~~GDKK01036329.1.p1  ORF type:complete len:149 (+),score=27.16 GDKK01036329.1:50-496(+)